jgi:hypothetical protein
VAVRGLHDQALEDLLPVVGEDVRDRADLVARAVVDRRAVGEDQERLWGPEVFGGGVVRHALLVPPAGAG